MKFYAKSGHFGQHGWKEISFWLWLKLKLKGGYVTKVRRKNT